MKQFNYFLLPLLFVAALIVFTVLMLPLSSLRVVGIDFISIWLIIVITTISSLVSLLVFIFFSQAAKRRARKRK